MPAAGSWFWNEAEWLAASPSSILPPPQKDLDTFFFTECCILGLLPLDSAIPPGTPQRVPSEGKGLPRNSSMGGNRRPETRSPTAKGMRQ